MTQFRHRRHGISGDWWPQGDGRASTHFRYGVMETSGFDNERGPRYSTSYLIIDLHTCGAVVREFRASGRPGTLKTQIVRAEACRFAAELNKLGDEEVAA